MCLSIRRAAAVGLGLVLAATALWASGDDEAAAEAEFVTVELTRLDGTTMTKEVEKPRYGGMVTMNREVLILMHSWDPKGGGGPHELANLQLLNQKLTQVDWARGPSGTGEYPNFVASVPPLYAVGNLAESWEYLNDTTLRLKMREGVRFWNKEDVVQPNPGLEDDYGRELTAHDAVWSYNTTNFFLQGLPATITWTAIDDHTLEMTWPQPDAIESALDWSGWAFIFNSGIANIPADQWTDWRNALGTGPFIPTDEVPGSIVTYKRNPNYWENDPIHTENRLPYVDFARIVDFDDEAGIIAALRAGQLDMTSGLGLSGKWGQQLAETDPEIRQAPAAATTPIWSPRVDLPESPFSDIKVRQALMMAIPRDEIVEEFYGGNAVPYGYPVFPHFPDWFVEYEDLPTEPTRPGSCASARDAVTYLPEKAKQCLAAAGYPDGFEFDLWTSPSEREFNELYAGYWNEVGIRANIKVVELAVWQSIKDREDHTGLASWTPGSWISPFSVLFNQMASNATANSARVNDPVYDETVRVVNQEFDNEKRKAAWREFVSYALEGFDYMSGVGFHKLNFWNPWVKGYSGERSTTGIQGWHNPAKYIWIDQNMQP